MRFKHEDSKFKLFVEGEEVGSLTYVAHDNVLHFNSVNVDPAHQNQGYAFKILNEAVSYVRENNLKVLPVCPYVINAFYKGGFEDIDVR